MNKYCTKVKLRASIGETQSSHCQRNMPFPRRMTQNVSDAMLHAAGLLKNVLQLCLLLLDISGSLEILDNNNVIHRNEKL